MEPFFETKKAFKCIYSISTKGIKPKVLKSPSDLVWMWIFYTTNSLVLFSFKVFVYVRTPFWQPKVEYKLCLYLSFVSQLSVD